MADLDELHSSGSTKIAGSDATGNETNFVDATSLRDLQVADVPNQTGLNATLSLTTTAQELKVGGSTMTNRKYVKFEALSNNVKWGDDTNCLFDAFKSQFFMIPAGTTNKIYMKMSSGTGTASVGES